jgi:hypothetical protein
VTGAANARAECSGRALTAGALHIAWLFSYAAWDVYSRFRSLIGSPIAESVSPKSLRYLNSCLEAMARTSRQCMLKNSEGTWPFGQDDR